MFALKFCIVSMHVGEFVSRNSMLNFYAKFVDLFADVGSQLIIRTMGQVFIIKGRSMTASCRRVLLWRMRTVIGPCSVVAFCCTS